MSEQSSSSTIELARKLGLIRSRKVSCFLHPQISSKPSTSKPQTHLGGHFRYYIVIDFESTCWPDKRMLNPSPEVIEFPAVLYDAKNRTVPADPLSVFHGYVMPTEEPTLSKFCTELTGINQDQVNSGCPLPTTLYLFKKWISDISLKYNLSLNELSDGKNPCTFVTWTDWDLKICLENECKRKGINKPRYLDAWIDLKWTYQKFYGRKPKGLNGALKETGLDFDGREHSGICDAKNTAKLLGKMLDDRCTLGITKVINGAKIDPKLKYDESSLSAGSIKAFLEKYSSSKKSEGGPPAKTGLSSKPGLRDITNENQNSDASRKTPFTGVRTTPPLCSCGRRAKRLVASKPGPNQGRYFFSCSIRKMEAANQSKNGCSFFKWDDQGHGGSPNFSKTFTSTNSSKNFDKTFQNLRKSLPAAASSKSFSIPSSKEHVHNSDEHGRTFFQPNLPVTKNVALMLSNINNAENRNEAKAYMKSTSVSNLPTENIDKTQQQNRLQISSNQNINQQSRAVMPVSKSLTSIIAKEKTVNNAEPGIPASKSFTTFSSIQKSELLRPTLGPARRSNVGLLQPPQPGVVEVHTPEMKRARLNFNHPVFPGGRNLISGNRCLVPQYFGNVPFHSS